MALTAYFRLRSFVKERRPIIDLGELVPVGSFLHQSVAIDTRQTAACMRACLPIGLTTALMTAKASFILEFGRLARILAKRDQPAHTFAAATGDMIASRTVTIFAS